MADPVKQKKRGRPATGHDPLVGVRMSAELRARIEAWAKGRAGTGNLSEAVRQLIEKALPKPPRVPGPPGLKIRKTKTGPAFYWVAAAVSRHAKNYPLKTMRLMEKTADARAARCRALTAELRQWLGDPR